MARVALTLGDQAGVGPEVIADLMALKMAQDIEAKDFGPNYNPEGLVVVNEVGEPIRPETYSGWFEKHTEAAGLPKIRLHDLRHTAASLLASQGVPIIIASELLGHDPQIFTKVYADLYPEDLKQAASTLNLGENLTGQFTIKNGAGETDTIKALDYSRLVCVLWGVVKGSPK